MAPRPTPIRSVLQVFALDCPDPPALAEGVLLKGSGTWMRESRVMSRDVISDEVWAVIGPLLPAPKSTGR
ncbi:hypothetical protein NWP10_02600, partial [Micrococcus sp. HG099]|uniref:hypothetical protein n=1 Tax=Micrococcus sp. HG099 TaxID=2969755 RepID=UPI00215ADFA8